MIGLQAIATALKYKADKRNRNRKFNAGVVLCRSLGFCHFLFVGETKKSKGFLFREAIFLGAKTNSLATDVIHKLIQAVIDRVVDANSDGSHY